MTVRSVDRPLVEQLPQAGRRNRRPLAVLLQSAVTPRVILIGMCFLYLVPFYWMATTALKDNPELNIYPPNLWPLAPNPGNFISAIRYIPFPQFFINSVILTAGTAIGAGISNPLIAYGFARIKWPGRDFVFAIVIIFAAVAAWNEFLLPLIYLQDESRYPLAIGLQFFRSQHNVQYNLLMAASTLVVLPVLALFLGFQKFFIEGVSVGAVKG